MLKDKLKEVLTSVLPISVIVLILNFTIAPLPLGTFGLFIVGVLLLILGTVIFMIGADISMLPMGEMVGAQLTKSKKISLFVLFGFIIGFIITIAEPDVQVLAKQFPAVPDQVLIVGIAVGVGLFLVVALLRIIFKISLSKMLMGLYLLVFALAAFTPPEFLSVAFDSGGVTTGPITVPFILSLGIGVAAVRGGNSSSEDSFGLVALASIGPILAMIFLGLFSSGAESTYIPFEPPIVSSIPELLRAFSHALPEYAWEIFLALSPMAVIFAIFQLIFLRLKHKQLIKIGVGILYTFIGLVLFLVGVNVGFMPAGKYIGHEIAALDYNWILVPIGMVMGFCVVAAEPAVHVLNNEVEDISGGSISKAAMLLSLSIGVAVSIGIAMLRVLTGISIWYFILPLYILALSLTFFVPKIFTAIAFDSGGVASGAMTATFLLPFAMGACDAIGGNVLTDAFGLVAMVAVTPLITIQLLGLVYKIKGSKADSVDSGRSGDECDDYINISDEI